MTEIASPPVRPARLAGSREAPVIAQAPELPQAIDSARPYHEGASPDAGPGRYDYQGGMEWTPEADRYFGPMVPLGVARARDLRRRWWLDPYLLGLVRRALGVRGCEAVLAWRRDRELYWSVMRRFRAYHDDWLEQQDRRARRAVRRAIPDLVPLDWDATGRPRGPEPPTAYPDDEDEDAAGA